MAQSFKPCSACVLVSMAALLSYHRSKQSWKKSSMLAVLV
jgi:hypothetical protein